MLMINKNITLLCFVIYSFNLHCLGAQKPSDSSNEKSEHLFKLTLLESSLISNVNLKCEYEFVTRNKSFGFAIEGGKTFYSNEEKVKATGSFISPSVTYYYFNKFKNTRLGFKLKPFYHEIFLNDYLKFSRETPFQYHEYVKTDYSKIRYGAYLFQNVRQYINSNFFIEGGFGVGFVSYNTIVPDGVSQRYFENGEFSNAQNYEGPSFYVSMQIGYRF